MRRAVRAPAPPVDAEPQPSRPYRLNPGQDWVERLPLPPWAFYSALLLALILLLHFPLWLEGSPLWGSFDAAPVAGALGIVYFLALIRYLNGTARRALANYRPLLDVNDEEYVALEVGLTRIPGRIAFLAAAVGGLLGAASLFSDPQSWGVKPNSTALGATMALLLAISVQASIGYWAAQVIRQARAIDRIHRMTKRLNLFRRDPVYAFSALTLRSALGLLLFGYAYLLSTIYLGTPEPSLVDTVAGAAASSISLAIFVLPLSRMQRLLAAEKHRLLLQADERYSLLVNRFNRQLDKAQLADLDSTSKAMTSLAVQRESLAKISTWPWRPEALRSLLSTMAAPIVLYLVSRLLGRLFGV